VRLTASLRRLILARLRHDERGVVAAIVAILLGTGVLLGMGALVIDVGQIYQERAELQNGADAAALAVAESCALGACTPGVAGQLADGNASSLTGGTAGVQLVCGSDGLPGCPAPTGALYSCPAAPPAGTNFVEVYTETRTASGSTLLPPAFATSIMGAGYKGTTVRACAQAEWGPPATATVTALTISACEWDSDTSQGTSFASAPPYSVNPQPAPGFDHQLTLGPGNSNGCLTEPGGADGRKTFGWARDTTGNCSLPVSGAFPASGGPSFACRAVLQNAQQSQIAIPVPVYVSLNGGNSYGLKGFADFVVTGYKFSFGFAADWLNPANTCTTNNCLSGYFVQGIIPTTGSFAGSSLGAYVIDLTG
jgi:Flp pilus assembly protein TadG